MDRIELFHLNAEKIDFVLKRSRHMFGGKTPVIVLANLANKHAASFALKFSDYQDIKRLLDSDVASRAPSVIFPVEPNDDFIDFLSIAYPDCAHVISATNSRDSFCVLILGIFDASAVVRPISDECTN